MSEVKELGSTTIVSHPSWTGRGFVEPKAQAYWLAFADSLQRLAAREIAAGTPVNQILRNHDRGIVLLGLSGAPRTGEPAGAIVVHTEHRYGNYCYDDTICTYEDAASGHFLAFLAEDAE